MRLRKEYLWALLRISLGWIFLWAFIDKLFGLGYATKPENAWLLGISPTTGFLSHTTGPFASFYQSIAGSALVDWLFMLGLLLIGLAFLLGIGMRIASAAGALLMLLMFTAVLPIANNPFLDEHIIYFILFLLLPRVNAGETLGLGKRWKATHLVRSHPLLA